MSLAALIAATSGLNGDSPAAIRSALIQSILKGNDFISLYHRRDYYITPKLVISAG